LRLTGEGEMGVDIWGLDFLFRIRNPKRPFGRTLFIGRAGMYFPEELKEMAQQVVSSYDKDTKFSDLLGDGYAEELFRYLGSTEVETLDASDYEGAQHIHDLNRPIPASLKGKFDTVFDNGSLEHIFNVAVSMQNLKDLVAVGGLAMMITPANNWLGHGLYQFSPELLYQVFSKESGFEVERMDFVDIYEYPNPRHAENPIAAGRRIEIHLTKAPTYICMAARKIGESRPSEFMQSDYVALWDANKGSDALFVDDGH
jgi:hypothetical protein